MPDELSFHEQARLHDLQTKGERELLMLIVIELRRLNNHLAETTPTQPNDGGAAT